MPNHTPKEKKKQPKKKKKGAKGGAKGESLHKRATDPREARPALLGLKTFSVRTRRA